MEKTTVYLPADLKRRLTRVANRRGVPAAALIREGIDHIVRGDEPVRPRLGIFRSGDATLAERVDEELSRGFGRR